MTISLNIYFTFGKAHINVDIFLRISAIVKTFCSYVECMKVNSVMLFTLI